MPRFLRKIRMSRWAKEGNLSWVPNDDLPADPLADLATLGNTLSLCQIEDDNSNIDAVIVALVATMDSVQSIDYIIFPAGLIAAAGIECRQTLGKTPFEPAQKWHRDLVSVSALRLVALAKDLFASGEKARIPRHEILRLLTGAVKSGHVDLDALKEGVRADVARSLGT